jgi:hypothetical protein
MVFARGIDVGTFGGASCSGTSFAAPEIAHLLDAMWRAAPSLTSDQVSEAFDQALDDCPRPTSSPKNSVPQNAEGVTPQDFINCAIEQAKVVDTLTNAFLGVGKGGDGSGSVTSIPAGINCGTDCSEIYPINTQVTLTATPADGSTFERWSGACTGTGACVLTMDADKATTATFTAEDEPTSSDTITCENDLEISTGPAATCECSDLFPIFVDDVLVFQPVLACSDDTPDSEITTMPK